MALFRLFLATILLTVTVYTIPVVIEHGLDIFPIFFGDIAKMTWPGQFNLDFFGFLLMSGLWVAWRHHFKPLGLLLAPVATLGGIPFLAIYLLIASFQTDGDVKALMLGKQRAAI